MEDAIVLYAPSEHLNSISVLARFITKQHPSLSVIVISTSPESAFASSNASLRSITYHRLRSASLPPNLTKDPVELLFEIPRLYNPILRQTLVEISHKSNLKALIIDMFCNSAFEISTSLNIPTYFYVGGAGAFGVCMLLFFPTLDETLPQDIGDLNDYLEMPGCPPVFSSDFPKGVFNRRSNTYKHFLDTARNMRKANGIVVNSFDALEFRAKEALSNGLCIPDGPTLPVYFIGPLVAKTISQENGSIEHECLKWLDMQPSKSVIFLCFGRRGLFSAEQLKEMAVGLENSAHRFLWLVRNPPGTKSASEDPDLDVLLPEGFLERTKDRGLVIKTWAPQKEVLSHEAVGGFVTHCGRSSVLESVSFGVPMIGWPMYAEQRMSRVFMVEEMKVALPLEEEENGFVKAAELERRVKELMGSQVGRGVRHRMKEMKMAAKAAAREGGSSVVALRKLITMMGV